MLSQCLQFNGFDTVTPPNEKFVEETITMHIKVAQEQDKIPSTIEIDKVVQDIKKKYFQKDAYGARYLKTRYRQQPFNLSSFEHPTTQIYLIRNSKRKIPKPVYDSFIRPMLIDCFRKVKTTDLPIIIESHVSSAIKRNFEFVNRDKRIEKDMSTIVQFSDGPVSMAVRQHGKKYGTDYGPS